MNITKATYGDYDVLDIVTSFIRDGVLRISPTNTLFKKDPKPGIIKYLDLIVDNISYSIKENEYFEYPKNTNIQKLGIFYTNNNIPRVVEYCLKDLVKFEKKADIFSCVWKHIPNNPFHELTAYTQNSHHLNITIQILQLLYAAQDHKQYDYVSFLEHDVLYPEDYFDFDGFGLEYKGLVNANYVGLCSQGFQKKNQNDLPLHQITMRFDQAIKHFETMMIRAVKERSVVLEVDNLQQRSCKNSSIHINHGNHFTSHYNIYSKKDVSQYDNYWGNGVELIQKIMNRN